MKILTIALAATLALASAALAWDTGTITTRFPSPVKVGTKVLPAGDATINVERNNSDYVILAIHAKDGEVAGVVATRITSDPDNAAGSRVVFAKAGEALKLERVWLDDGTGFAVLPNSQ